MSKKNQNQKDVRCVACRAEFTNQEIEGKSACPACQSKSIPCDINMDVRVKINIHELRILGIFAENYARSTKDQSLLHVIDMIAQSIEAQLPPKKWRPLTMSRELRDLKEQFPKSKITFLPDNGEPEEL